MNKSITQKFNLQKIVGLHASKGRRKIYIKIVLACIVYFSVMSFSVAYASTLNSGSENGSAASSNDFGVAGKDYVPGEAIVCIKNTEQTNNTMPLSFSAMLGNQGFLNNNAYETETLMVSKPKKNTEDNEQPSILGNHLTSLYQAYNNESNNDAESTYSLVLVRAKDKDINNLIKELEQNPNVVYAEPNMLAEINSFKPEDATNEPMFKQQWYVDKTATNSEFDIDAINTYKNPQSANSKETVVAVMDTGVDYNHPDLKDSMWDEGLNIPELKNLGGGKYGIDPTGTNALDDPYDSTNGHGTHCATTIASTWKNSTGIAGINGNVKIMGCKIMDSTSALSLSGYIKAYNYVITAKQCGVNVVATSNSWGLSHGFEATCKSVEYLAERAANAGIVTIFAAGNAEYNHDKYTNGSYSSPYIVEVGAMESSGEASFFTERGARSVDVFAPGTEILAGVPTTPGKIRGPQYYPWLQDSSDSYFYETFDDVKNSNITFDAYKYDINTGEKIGKFTETRNDVAGYPDNRTDSNCAQIDFDGLKDNDMFAVELAIPVEKLKNLPQTNDVKFAFIGGFKDVDYFSSASLNLHDCREVNIEYLDENNTWHELSKWRVFDNNWSSYCTNINISGTVSSLRGKSIESLNLRLTTCAKNVGKNPSFHIDCIGFGSNVIPYCYMSGTSMACPCVAAIASYIASVRDTLPASTKDVLEIIAKIKGGVVQTGKLDNDCVTKGCAQLSSAFKTPEELNPVPMFVNISDNIAEIKGYYFGDKGTVTVDGQLANIIYYSDSLIKIEIPENIPFTESEYVIIRNDNKSGRNFENFHNFNEIGYKDIEVGNIDYEFFGNPMYNTSDLKPLHMAANNNGIMAIFNGDGTTGLYLEYYSFNENKWYKIDFPEEVPEEKYYDYNFSIAGSGDEFYLLWNIIDKSQGKLVAHLSTFNTKSNNWTNNIILPSSFKGGEVIACSDGKLYVTLGTESSDFANVYQISPDNGQCRSVTSDIPDEIKGKNGGEFLISGLSKSIVGANLGIADGDGFCSEPAIFKDGKWEMSNAGFFVKDNSSDGFGNCGPDCGQSLKAAYGALNNGFIIAGPSRDIDQPNMVDTWVYDYTTDKYTALADVRLDSQRANPLCGVSHDNKFYVLYRSAGENNSLKMKCLDLTQYGLKVTDSRENVERFTGSEFITSIGNTFLDNQNGGYYVVGDNGKLTHDGASSQNWNVAYDSKNNTVTLSNLHIEDLMNNRNIESRCVFYSKNNLTVNINGSNSLQIPESASNSTDEQYGMFLDNNSSVTFAGDGDLEINYGGTCCTGLYSTGNINFFQKGKISVNTDSAQQDMGIMFFVIKQDLKSIFANEDIVISGGIVSSRIADESIEDGLLWQEMPYKGICYEGLHANNLTINNGASLIVENGKISYPSDDITNIAIDVQNSMFMERCSVETSVGETINKFDKSDELNVVRSSYSKPPVLVDGFNATTLYGQSIEEAEKNGDKSFQDFLDNIDMPYTCVVSQINFLQNTNEGNDVDNYQQNDNKTANENASSDSVSSTIKASKDNSTKEDKTHNTNNNVQHENFVPTGDSDILHKFIEIFEYFAEG